MTSARGLLQRFGGFSLIGLGNTLLSMGLIYVMVERLGVDCRVAYAMAYAVTVALAYLANAWLVFCRPPSINEGCRFAVAYSVGMVLGTGLLQLFVVMFPSVNPVLLSSLVLTVTTGFNFFMANIVFKAVDRK